MSELIDHLTCLTRLRDAEGLDHALAELARNLLQCRGAAIHRLFQDRDAQHWLTTASAGEPPALARPDPLQLRPDSRCEQPPRCDDCPALSHCLRLQQATTAPGLPLRVVLPLSALDGCDAPGVIELALDRPLDPQSERTVASLLRFYHQLRGLIDESERDSLTGLLNRKTFDETFVRAAQGVPVIGERPGAPGRWFLGMVDIDHFKRINDTHGHLIGDEVLLLVARTMRATLRLGDRLYRFGGEEFVVLLRTPDATAAGSAFERLRQTIADTRFPQIQQLTVSVGFTALDPDDTPGTAIERADRAVYEAKDRGRNQSVCAEDLAERQTPADAPAASEVEFF